MARVIGEAAVRLRADGRGLAQEMTRVLTRALREASAAARDDSDIQVTRGVEEAAQRSANRVTGILSGLLGRATSIAGSIGRAVTSGARLALIGTAAGGALAGVTSLAVGLVGLVSAAGQAAGAVGLLPAVMLAVKAATATVTLATSGMGDAFKAVAEGDAAKLSEALEGLAPAAREFVLAVRDVKPAFDQLRLNVQQTAFRGLAESIQPLTQRYLPLAQRLFGGIADAMNQAGRDAAAFALEGEVVGQTSLLVDNIRAAFAKLTPAVTPALSAFLDISQVGSEFLPRLASGLTAASERFGEFIRNAAASGQLEAFFQRALDTISALFDVLQQVGGIIGGIFRAAETASGGFLGGLRESLATFREFIDSAAGQNALVSFFQSMQTILDGLAPAIQALVSVVGGSLAPILADLARIIGPALTPVIEGIGAALDAARPGIQTFAYAFASLMRAVAPLLPVLGEVIGALATALAPVLLKLGPIIAKVGEVIANSLLEFLPQLEPILIQIVEAFGQIITAVLPLVPVFFQLLRAILPILPPLFQFISAILPPLISLVQAVVPIIISLADVIAALIPPITEVVTTILNILIPPINLIADIFANVARLVADNVQFMSNIITSVFRAIGSFITGIWGTIVNIFRGAVQSIGNFVRGGFQAVRDTISGVINGIRNTVGTGINNVIGFFRDLPGKALGFLQDLAGKAFEAGKNIVQGIINGLGNLAGAIFDKIVSIVSAAWDGVLDFFGISSPAKRAIKAFEDVGRGAIVGLDNIAPKVAAAAANMGADAMDSLQAPLNAGVNLNAVGTVPGGAGGVGGGAIVLNQTNIMTPGSDVGQFSTQVSQRLAQRLASGTSTLPVSQGNVQQGMAPPDSVFGVTGIG